MSMRPQTLANDLTRHIAFHWGIKRFAAFFIASMLIGWIVVGSAIVPLFLESKYNKKVVEINMASLSLQWCEVSDLFCVRRWVDTEPMYPGAQPIVVLNPLQANGEPNTPKYTTVDIRNEADFINKSMVVPTDHIAWTEVESRFLFGGVSVIKSQHHVSITNRSWSICTLRQYTDGSKLVMVVCDVMLVVASVMSVSFFLLFARACVCCIQCALRRLRGRCPVCDYPESSGQCPECGT